MKNTLGDLNNHLFAQLEKLGDDDLTGEELESELKRTDAICDISEQIIKNGELRHRKPGTDRQCREPGNEQK